MTDYIPVVPACHYTVVVGWISVVKLPSIDFMQQENALLQGCMALIDWHQIPLLEGLVYADRIHKDILNCIDGYQFKEGIPDWNAEGTQSQKEMVFNHTKP